MDFFSHYLQVVILGIVEGVTEFLPISSTGHLLIAEHLLGTEEPDVFNVVIQAGAILAVVVIYWHKLAELFGNLDKTWAQQYVAKLGAAFVVTGALGFALTHHFHLKLPEALLPVAWATLIGGLVIFVVEYLAKNLYPHDDVSWPEAILIGLAQILAGIFPGTSRSGATIMTGLGMGMKRTAATEFSFLLGIPTMFAASALDLVKAHKELTSGGHQLLLDIALGFFVSAVVAFFVIKWLLHFIQSHTFNGFAIYRVILGAALLAALYTHTISDVGAKEKVAEPSVPAPAQVEPAPGPIPPSPAPAPTEPVPVPAPAATPAPVPPADSVTILPPATNAAPAAPPTP